MSQEKTGGEKTTSLTRRQLLSAGVAGLVSGVVGTLLLDNTPASPTVNAETDQVSKRATGISESTHPYAVWQYHYNRDGEDDNLAVASPINIVFPLESADFADLTATVEDAGWTGSPLEYTLWAWDRESTRYQRPDWSGAETVFGLGGRMHVRVWHFEGTASMQAHVDSAVVPSHQVTSYADAELAVARMFEDAGWIVDSTLDLENATPPDHDGTVSVIRR